MTASDWKPLFDFMEDIGKLPPIDKTSWEKLSEDEKKEFRKIYYRFENLCYNSIEIVSPWLPFGMEDYLVRDDVIVKEWKKEKDDIWYMIETEGFDFTTIDIVTCCIALTALFRIERWRAEGNGHFGVPELLSGNIPKIVDAIRKKVLGNNHTT
jgi:hypothetical protein